VNDREDWADPVRRWKVIRVFGVGALAAGAITIAIWLALAAMLVGPVLFWFAWNVLDFGPAVGLPELGFWAILLATLFLVVGWFGKVTLAGVVFLADPSWLQGEALMRWPEPTLRSILAIAVLGALAARPHARKHRSDKRKPGKHLRSSIS